jgi:hypothetical protein
MKTTNEDKTTSRRGRPPIYLTDLDRLRAWRLRHGHKVAADVRYSLSWNLVRQMQHADAKTRAASISF